MTKPQLLAEVGGAWAHTLAMTRWPQHGAIAVAQHTYAPPWCWDF